MLQGWEKKNLEIAVAQCFNKALDNLPKTADDATIRAKVKHYFLLLSSLKDEIIELEEFKQSRPQEIREAKKEEAGMDIGTPDGQEPDLPEGVNDF